MRFAYSVSFDFFVYARTFTVDCLRYVFSVSRSSRAFRLSYFVSAVVRPRSVGDRGKSCANDDGRMIASFPFPTMIVFGSDYPLRSLRTFVNAARSVAGNKHKRPRQFQCFALTDAITRVVAG